MDGIPYLFLVLLCFSWQGSCLGMAPLPEEKVEKGFFARVLKSVERLAKEVRHIFSDECPYCEENFAGPIACMGLKKLSDLIFVIVWVWYCGNCKRVFRRTTIINMELDLTGGTHAY